MEPSKNDIEATGVASRGYGSRWIGWVLIALSLVGIGICLYLYSIHMSLLMGEFKISPLCGAEDGLGCHSVTSGAYSSIMGISLTVWGTIFFIALVLLGFGSVIFYRDCGWAFLRSALILTFGGIVFDAYLAYAMVFKINTVCWLCVSTYGVNFLLFILLALTARKEMKPRVRLRRIFPGTGDRRSPDTYYKDVVKAMLGVCLLIAAVGVVGGSQFLSRALTANDRERLVKIIENLSMQKPVFVQAKGSPAMGPENANVLVIEFSDFLCPFCTMGAKYLKLTASDFKEDARFVFRHYPLDKSCNPRLSRSLHPGSCLLAEGAACADEQGKFWAYHDTAFGTGGQISRSLLMKIAANVDLDTRAFQNCLDSGRGLRVVQRDIDDAMRAGIRSTPTLIINGRMLRGVPKPWMLNEILRYAAKNLPLQEAGK